MKYYYYLFIFIFSLLVFAEKSIIEQEKQFLEKKDSISKIELIEFFGPAQDSMKKGGLQLLIWDNLFGEMTLHSAPPYTPLDSANFFGKRVLHVVIDSNDLMKEYDYWDYTNPQDFIERGLIEEDN